MRAEIVSVGTELLLGNIVDTNAAYIARQLAIYGIDAFWRSTVGDNLDRCAATLATALERSDAVIVTGGIGPTPDDATRGALARALGVPLERRPELVAEIEAFYAARGREPNAAAWRQADLPAGAEVIPNPTGTAPGILAVQGQRVVYVLPGVPSEMVRMLHESVLPDLRRRFGLADGLFCRVLRCRGIGESDLATRLDDLLREAVNPTVATYVKTAEVEVRLTVRAADATAAEALLAPLEAIVRERAGEWIYAVDDEGLEVQLGRLLRAAGATLATAESCTGGMLGETLTRVSGSSDYYVGGVVAYANAVKQRLLGVPADLLECAGAVSAAVAGAMARGVCAALGADLGLAVTGIAGPGGGTAEKPVGLVFVAVYDQRVDTVEVAERRLRGDRAAIRERTVLEALELACRRLAGSTK